MAAEPGTGHLNGHPFLLRSVDSKHDLAEVGASLQSSQRGGHLADREDCVEDRFDPVCVDESDKTSIHLG